MHADTFVGTLAIGLAIATAGLAIGPMDTSANLRLVVAIRIRFGDLAARGFVAFVALLLLLLGLMILRDLRPRFATPLTGNSNQNSAYRNRNLRDLIGPRTEQEVDDVAFVRL